MTIFAIPVSAAEATIDTENTNQFAEIFGEPDATSMGGDLEIMQIDSLEELDLKQQIPEVITEIDRPIVSNLDDIPAISNNVTTNNTLMRTRSIAEGSVTGFITAVNSAAQYNINLPANTYLQLQLDLPNNQNLDYDLYLLDATGQPLAVSDYYTYVNGSSGTVSEALGYPITTAGTYYFHVQSGVGASITESFTLKYSLSVVGEFDGMEMDESAYLAYPFTFSTMGVQLGTRNINSSIDSDWFYFTVPSGGSYDKVRIGATTTSQNTVGVEIYKNVGNEANGVYAMAKQNMSGGMLTVSPGKYYIRVYNTAPVFDSNDIQNYTLMASPSMRATGIATVLTGTSEASYVNYPGLGVGYRTWTGPLTISGYVYATVDGDIYPVANEAVTARYFNPGWDANNTAEFAYIEEDGYSDINGNFSVTIDLPPAIGNFSYYNGISTHYFDEAYAGAYLRSNSNIKFTELLWHFAYQII
jgi:hypothetical protein